MLLGDIQKHAALAAADHDAYVEHLVQLSEQESNGERISQQKEADTCKRRLDELDTLLNPQQRLFYPYPGRISGCFLPDGQYTFGILFLETLLKSRP